MMMFPRQFSRPLLYGALLLVCILTGAVGQIIPVEECPLVAECCEEDCCGPGTKWEASWCVVDSDSVGFNGTYSGEREPGCVERQCCNSDCCAADGTVYDTSIQSCVPTSNNVGYLNLFQKVIGTWEIVEGGASGELEYNLAGPEFVFDFSGRGLTPGTDYMLMYFPDPWPGHGTICLGNGTIDGNGDIHIEGSVDTGNLPIPTDANSEAKIWLALFEDVHCGVGSRMLSYQNQKDYLFEEKGIIFNDTDFEETDRLLPYKSPCSTNEQCDSGNCDEERCAECNVETSAGCVGNQRCLIESRRLGCYWPDFPSCEQDCPSGFCYDESPEDNYFPICAVCNPETQVGCDTEKYICLDKYSIESDTRNFSPVCYLRDGESCESSDDCDSEYCDKATNTCM